MIPYNCTTISWQLFHGNIFKCFFLNQSNWIDIILNLIITVAADALTPYGTRSSTSTVLITRIGIKFLWLLIIIPPAQWSCWVVYRFHSLHPSVRPISSVRPVVPRQFWLDPFHIYTSYQATPKGVSYVSLEHRHSSCSSSKQILPDHTTLFNMTNRILWQMMVLQVLTDMKHCPVLHCVYSCLHL